MWGQIIGAGVSAVGNIIGAAQARGAIKRAGTQLVEAGNREAADALAVPGQINPMIGGAYDEAGNLVRTASDQAAGDILGAGQQANQYLDPYRTAGGEALTSLSQLAQAPQEQFTGTNLEMDPGYQFRLSEGTKALERAAAARGSLQGGGTLKALTRYSQGEASQEYAKAFDRSLQGFKANQDARQQKLNTLSGLATHGYNAGAASGRNILDATRVAGDWRNRAAETIGGYGVNSATAQAGNLMHYGDVARGLRMGAEQAQANSIIGAGQATANMWSGGANALGGGIAMADFMGSRGAAAPQAPAVPNWAYGVGQMPGPQQGWGGLPQAVQDRDWWAANPAGYRLG